MMRSLSIRRVILTGALILVMGYALFEARGILRGPVILIDSPSSGDVVTEPLIHVTGTARNIKEIRMDARPIFISETGLIDEPLALLPGYNEVVFEGSDRFGKMTRIDLVLIYEPRHGDLPLSPLPSAASSSTATSTTDSD
jgi:hypothetical protein